MLLDWAENIAKKGKLMQMVDWDIKIDEFLKFNDYQVLKGY